MSDNPASLKYFQENAEAWLTDAYRQGGFNYPTPYHRLRIVRQILSGLEEIDSHIDVGCGGGQLAIALANDGKTVTGIDESEQMLSAAREAISKEPQEVQDRIMFEHCSLQEVEESQFDSLTAMGVIGYLPDDDVLFETANRLLRQGGYALISFRNRLFNLFSISHRTIKEAEESEFSKLVEEAARLREPVPEDLAWELVQQLHFATGKLLENRGPSSETESPSSQQGLEYVGQYEARQSTPADANESAKRLGFEQVQLYGIHPHWSLPALNEMLPPQVYNTISDSLLVLENQQSSLLWSSVFIGVYKKL